MTLTIGLNVTLPAPSPAAFIVTRDGLQATKTVYATRVAAMRAADLLDAKYGAYKYIVKGI